MFNFEVATMIGHFKKLMPELWAVINELKADLSKAEEVYRKCPAQSIDYGIMEKLQEQVCIPCDLGWSDVGSWDEIAKLGKSAVLTEIDGEHNYVYSKQNRAVGFVGLSDVIVVDTSDALLIAKKGSTREGKKRD